MRKTIITLTFGSLLLLLIPAMYAGYTFLRSQILQDNSSALSWVAATAEARCPSTSVCLTPIAYQEPTEEPTVISPPVTDLAPRMPMDLKVEVWVIHANGHEQAYMVPPDKEQAFIEHLPRGDKFEMDASPAIIMENQVQAMMLASSAAGGFQPTPTPDPCRAGALVQCVLDFIQQH